MSLQGSASAPSSSVASLNLFGAAASNETGGSISKSIIKDLEAEGEAARQIFQRGTSSPRGAWSAGNAAAPAADDDETRDSGRLAAADHDETRDSGRLAIADDDETRDSDAVASPATSRSVRGTEEGEWNVETAREELLQTLAEAQALLSEVPRDPK